MSKDFSAAPLTVNGTTVKPKWRWSAQHRAEVAEGMRQNSQSDIPPVEAERRYVEWYAAKHGLSIDVARRRVEAMT